MKVLINPKSTQHGIPNLLLALSKLQQRNNHTGIDLSKSQISLLRHKRPEAFGILTSNINGRYSTTLLACERWELGIIEKGKPSKRVVLYWWIDDEEAILEIETFGNDNGKIEVRKETTWKH